MEKALSQPEGGVDIIGLARPLCLYPVSNCKFLAQRKTVSTILMNRLHDSTGFAQAIDAGHSR